TRGGRQGDGGHGSYLSDLMRPFLGHASNRAPDVSWGLIRLSTLKSTEVILNESPSKSIKY
ncbi:hypothetical protein, partial [Methylobacterium fujisawaense]